MSAVFTLVCTSTARLWACQPQWKLRFQSDANWIYNNLITEKYTYLFLYWVSSLNDLLVRVTCRLYYAFTDEINKQRAYSNPSFKLVFTIYYNPCCHLFSSYLQLYTWNKPCSKGTYFCGCSVFKFVLHVTLFHSWTSLLLLLLLLLLLYDMDVSCHRPFLPGTSLEPAVIPTAQASSFTLQYLPYYVWCSKYSCLL